MRINIKNLAFVLAITFFLSACKKNSVDKPAGIPKVNKLSFIYNAGMGNPTEPSQVDFSYDDNDRVKSILIYLGNSGVAIPPTDTMTTVNFFYNGANKLPNSIFLKKHVNGSIWEMHLLTYDANNRIVKDSISQSASNFSILYSYDGNKTIRYNTSIGSWGNDTLVSQDGNYVQFLQKGTSFHFEFDDKINPLNSLNIGPVYHVIAMYGGIWSFWTASNINNITAVKAYSNGVLQSSNYSMANYTYSTRGLPQKRIWYYSATPQNVIDTMSYKY